MSVVVWTKCSIKAGVIGFYGSMIIVDSYNSEHGKTFDMFLVIDGNRCFFDFCGMVRVDVMVMDEMFIKGELSLEHVLFSIVY